MTIVRSYTWEKLQSWWNGQTWEQKGNIVIFLRHGDKMKNSATMTHLNRDRIYCNAHGNDDKMYINTVVMVRKKTEQSNKSKLISSYCAVVKQGLNDTL